jgi:hypothetical protein
MGVLINKLCNDIGFCFNWEEQGSEKDNSTDKIVERLVQPLVDNGTRGCILYTDTRFTSVGTWVIYFPNVVVLVMFFCVYDIVNLVLFNVCFQRSRISS